MPASLSALEKGQDKHAEKKWDIKMLLIFVAQLGSLFDLMSLVSNYFYTGSFEK